MPRLGEILESHGTLMISKENCGFCEASGRFFERHGVTPHVIKLEDHPGEEMRKFFGSSEQKRSTRRSRRPSMKEASGQPQRPQGILTERMAEVLSRQSFGPKILRS